MPREFILPDLGEGITEAQVVRVLIHPGDQVSEDQYLMEVETDKAAVEIPSPYAGIARKVHVEPGQVVNVGDVIVTFDDGAGSGPAQKTAERKPAEEKPAEPARTEAEPADQESPRSQRPAEPAAPRLEESRPKTSSKIAAAPAVRKLAREHGVDLADMNGSGPGGRVTKEDVEAYLAAGRTGARPAAGSAPSAPRPPHSSINLPEGTSDRDKWGSIRRVPLNQIRKTIANQMSRAAFTIPHVTHCDEADITELDRMRRHLNEATGGDPKLTAMSFLIRAVCIAIRKYPIFNASFDEEAQQIIYKEYVNMGIAVDTERGLVVPVIRDVNRMTLRDIAVALRTISDRIRSNQFGIDDLRGGTFTITNVGGLGGVYTTPIINHPEVAILGLGRSRRVPVIRSGEVSEALVLPLSLSFDHRATDGANAARFTREVISYLETPARFLLD